MKTGLHIGNMREKEEYAALADAMLKILQSGQEQKTTRKALDVFVGIAEVKNINVSNIVVNARDDDEEPEEV